MGQTVGAVLAFNQTDRYFYLHIEEPARRTLLVDPDVWERVDESNFRTDQLRAAARFRPYADETTERLFVNVFNRELVAPPLPQLTFLDPHQRQGVRWILTRARSYLAHAPGAGKTAEAIVAGSYIKTPGTTVIIVPPGLTLNWEREIWKFSELCGQAFPTVGVVGTSANQKSVAWRADFLIVPDSMLSKSWVYDRLRRLPTKLLVVDEASRFKDPGSIRAKVLFGGQTRYRAYPGLCRNAQRTVLLDGSPMPNRPMELWAPVYALDPETIDCMGQRDFGFKYCGARMNERGSWEFKYSSNEQDLRDRLRRRFMHVVTESELSHPERRRSLLFMNQDVRTPEMRTWERKNLALLKGEISEDLSQGEIAHHRKDLGVRKIPWVAKYILSRLENKNERILLFAWHREVCIGLAKAIPAGRQRAAVIMGGTPAGERDDALTRFQSGDLRIIIGNIAAMGRGHNLQRADRVVFAEPSWSDELNRQCEKRASRRGRDEEAFVRCEYVVVPGSIDERVMTALFSKQSRVKRIIG